MPCSRSTILSMAPLVASQELTYHADKQGRRGGWALVRVNDAAHLDGGDPTRSSSSSTPNQSPRSTCGSLAFRGSPASDSRERDRDMQKPRETLGGLEPRPSLGRASAMAAKFEQLMAEAHFGDD
jgi:hypothetical protein